MEYTQIYKVYNQTPEFLIQAIVRKSDSEYTVVKSPHPTTIRYQFIWTNIHHTDRPTDRLKGIYDVFCREKNTIPVPDFWI